MGLVPAATTRCFPARSRVAAPSGLDGGRSFRHPTHLLGSLLCIATPPRDLLSDRRPSPYQPDRVHGSLERLQSRIREKIRKLLVCQELGGFRSWQISNLGTIVPRPMPDPFQVLPALTVSSEGSGTRNDRYVEPSLWEVREQRFLDSYWQHLEFSLGCRGKSGALGPRQFRTVPARVWSSQTRRRDPVPAPSREATRKERRDDDEPCPH